MEIRKERGGFAYAQYYSDGDCSVGELVKRIKEAGLKAAVLTDHDKVDGTKEFLKYCEIEDISSSPVLKSAHHLQYLQAQKAMNFIFSDMDLITKKCSNTVIFFLTILSKNMNILPRCLVFTRNTGIHHIGH